MPKLGTGQKAVGNRVEVYICINLVKGSWEFYQDIGWVIKQTPTALPILLIKHFDRTTAFLELHFF